MTLLILAFLFISYTPLKTYIPGYGKIEDQTAFIELKKEFDVVKEELDAREVYISALRRMLTDDPESISENIEKDSMIQDTSPGPVKRSPEDEILRKDVENENLLALIRDEIKDSKGSSNKAVDLNTIHFTSPVKGEISAKFMPEKEHYGVDIMAPKNTAIKAVLEGIVITADWTLETGNTIGIQHSNNLITFYKHNSTLLKQVGDIVKAGEAIAIIGNTGTLTSGPHLHFELWQNGAAINPTEFISFE